MGNRINFAPTSVLATLMTLTACGDASFQAGAGGKPNPTSTNTNTSTDIKSDQKLTSLNWYWQCASAPGDIPTTKEGDVVISGEGSHEFKKEQIGTGIPVTIAGRVCPPAKYPRDIVFVIDVSGSMSDPDIGNDTLTGNSCGRFKAIEAIIDGITSQGGDSQFGIVTFSDSASSAPTRSKAMWKDKSNLYSDLAGAGRTAPSVICAANGGTYYDQGLQGAQALLNGSRDGALKEIYFISDGKPSDEAASAATATALKTVGIDLGGKKYPVQLATVMLGSVSDTILKSIASIDKAGKSLHAKQADSSKLAATLSSLAANEIDDGIIRYRATGTSPWTEVALKPNMKGYDFSIPSFQLTPESAPNGLDVVFEYHDLHNNKYSNGGNIVWSEPKN